MRVCLPKKILFFLLPLLLVKSSIAQIKLGNTATQLEKSALLELNGNRQGFLLPRILDTSLINSLNPPDGMLIYFMPATSGKGLYIRKTGFWQRMTTDSTLSANLNSWSLAGNSGLTGTEKLGPTGGTGFSLITSNTPRITITSAGVTSILGNTVLGGTLSFSSLLSANTADTSYLTINNTTNVVTKRNLTSLPFLQSLNGLTTTTQAFATTNTTGSFAFTSNSTTHTLNIPDATNTTNGFINTTSQTFAGDKTFSNNITINGTTQVGSTGTPLTSILKVTVNKDVASIAGNASSRVDFNVTGATVGSSVIVTPSAALPDNCVISYSRVRAAGIVEVMFTNTNQTTYTFNGVTVLGVSVLGSVTTIPGAAADPAAMDYYFTIIK
jgi:hypothetical protein